VKIIAVCGRKGAGKDEFGRICQKLVPGTVILKFAEPLHEALMALRDGAELPREKKEIYRAGLQTGGDLLKKECGDGVFTKRMVGSIRSAEKHGAKLVVITDLRFIVEARLLRETFGSDVSFVRVERHTLGFSAVNDQHSSEVEHATGAFVQTCYPGAYALPVVSNNGSLGQLDVAVSSYLTAKGVLKPALTDPKLVYIAGGMQFRKPGERDPRRVLKERLAELGVGARMAEDVIRDAGLENQEALFGKDSEATKRIMDADLTAVRNAKVLLVAWDVAAARGGGTHAEVAHAWQGRACWRSPLIGVVRFDGTELPAWTRASVDKDFGDEGPAVGWAANIVKGANRG